jgi:hypothetical protein
LVRKIERTRRRGRPRTNPWCPHPPGERCRACARAATKRWRAKLEKPEPQTPHAPKHPRVDSANARAYVATYRRRWGIPTLPCADCGSPRAGIVHPNPANKREYVWLCRACRYNGPERLAELVEDGHLRVLAKPPAQPNTSPPDPAAGKNPALLLPLAPLEPSRLAAARAQVTLAGKLGRRPDETLLAQYVLALLDPEALAQLQEAGAIVDLTLWRPFGIEDLDHSLGALFFRRRRAAKNRDHAIRGPA